MNTDSQQREFIREAASAKGPYGAPVAMSASHSRLRITIIGETDPNLPARILDVLTVGGNLPLQFHLVRDEQRGLVTIELEAHADEVPFPQFLADRILKIPSVISATTHTPG